ncbi:MAG TPA: hypothetical protein VE913_13390 [Longimicrobium sp.]|nr:hypothetical protein [Longimicrobium sp.]
MSAKVDRSNYPVRRLRLHDREPDHASMPSDEECIDMVWELTMNAWAFMGYNDVDPRLQRDRVRVVKRGAGS